ncbi:MAG: hypothetical protein K2H09_07130 [Treponemataceae bacterium]|nr:hypothetical protein [Treponemataceae bacterium]
MKRVRMIAAALAAASLCMGCSDGTNDDGIPGAPSVSLPESVGENPFKGRTFWEGGYRKYVFSEDGRTVTDYKYDADKWDAVYQYKCSVDVDKEELSWALEKMDCWGKLCSYDEIMRLYTDKVSFLAAAKAYYEEQLENDRIDKDEYRERLEGVQEYLNDYWDTEGKFDQYFVRLQFSLMQLFKYTYNEEAGTLDLEQQFERSASGFYFYDDDRTSIVRSAHICLSGFGWIRLVTDVADSTFFAEKFSASSSGEITFVNIENESDTFIATYELIDDGNDSQLNLLSTYKDKVFDVSIAFEPNELHLTEKMEGAE